MIAWLAEWWPLLVAFAAAFATATVGTLATDLSPWYYNLRKPSWQPPDWLFGPAWTTIFILTAIAGYLAWYHAPGFAAKAWVIAAYVLNAVLNMAWSWLFFTKKRPDWAFIEVIPFWLSIALLILVSGAHSPLASFLLLPYLLWVGFASWLNLAIIRLNGPFGVAEQA